MNEDIDALSKSLPHGTKTSPGEVRRLGWNVLRDDLHFPLLLLKESALEHNIRSMAAWCQANGLLLAPHGKTTMCPRIFERQLAAGAWALTAANVSQAEVCARFGAPRVLIANQVVGRAHVRSLAGLLAEYPGLDCYCLVDSIHVARSLAAGLEENGAARPLGVLVEWGRPDWRTGAHSLQQVRDLANEVQRHPQLALRGVEAFEGLAHDAAEVRSFLNEVARAASELSALLPGQEVLVSAGGSSYLGDMREFALQLGAGFKMVIRSGCYVTHDHGIYEKHYEDTRAAYPSAGRFPELLPALELWSYVQSRPKPGLAVLTFGKRDCSYDIGLPIPLFTLAAGSTARRPAGGTIVRSNDQHAFLEFAGGDDLQVGDKVCCGISHPCTAFDKWRVIPLVDDDYNVIDLYRTYF